MTSNCFGQRVELHRAGVGVHVAELDVGVLGGVHLGDDLAPEHARLHHVGLLHRADLVRRGAAPARRPTRGDPGDLALGVALGVDADALVALGEDAARLAEVDAARSARARSGCRARRPPRASARRSRPARRSTAPGAGWRRGPSPCAAAAARARASPRSRGRRTSARRPRRAAPRRPPAPSPSSRRSAARRARRRRSRRPGPPRPRTAGRGAPNQAMTLRTSAITSGPMPSPGRISRVGAVMASPRGLERAGLR